MPMPRSGHLCVMEAKNGMDKWTQMGAKPGCTLWETWDEICQKPEVSWHTEAAGQLSFRALLILLPTQPPKLEEERGSQDTH